MSENKLNPAESILEKYFGEDFLFDSVNSFFREKISPRDTSNLSEPPTITCAALLRYANLTVDEKNIDALQRAAASSSLVNAFKDDTGVWCLRRHRFLDPQRDPALRTVVVWPLHRSSKAEEVTEFFSAYGIVEKVAAIPRPRGDLQPHVSFSVCFATVEEAVACAGANITFGDAPSPLAQHFLPARLNVRRMNDYLAKTAARAREQGEVQLQSNVVQAQKALEEINGANIRRSLARGVTLKVEGVPAGTTWQMIKMKLGNLSLANATLKRGITLVKVEEQGAAGSSGKLRAFVVCRDAATANELRSCFSLAEGEFGKELRHICPALEPLTAEEEEYAQRHFPEWCKRRVETKQAQNQKRFRNA
ncbi:hypothetical protein ERJ75_000229000 [Trypanosoma vivax]|nr:hypothetical protein TRVL_06370 [Trypanosoma vivax]KAH8618899.1 hypothetical protein ERJ75_000229000 [Trypanosoma vivax]